MTGWYDRQGNPLDVMDANRLLGDREYKKVARTEESGYLVSTVWLGLDHDHTRYGPPIIFETMIFGPDSWDGEYSERYATEDAARAGHDRAVMILRNEILPAGAP